MGGDDCIHQPAPNAHFTPAVDDIVNPGVRPVTFRQIGLGLVRAKDEKMPFSTCRSPTRGKPLSLSAKMAVPSDNQTPAVHVGPLSNSFTGFETLSNPFGHLYGYLP
jgi:hypothetical protein